MLFKRKCNFNDVVLGWLSGDDGKSLFYMLNNLDVWKTWKQDYC